MATMQTIKVKHLNSPSQV